MRATFASVVAVALCASTVTPLSPQAPDGAREPMPVRLIPRVGLVSPDAYLYEQYANFSGDGPVEWTNGFLGRALLLGLGIEIGRTGGGMFLRGEILRSVDGWLTAGHSIVIPRQLFDPPRVQTTWLDIPTALTMTSLQLVVPTRLTLGPLQPYVLAGLAGKRYDFGEPRTELAVAAILPESGFTWGGDVGAGLTAPVLGLTFDFQGRDTINRYWGKTEHDLVFSTGVIWRIR